MVQPGPPGGAVVNLFFAVNPSPDGDTGSPVKLTPVGKEGEELSYWVFQPTSVIFKFAWVKPELRNKFIMPSDCRFFDSVQVFNG